MEDPEERDKCEERGDPDIFDALYNRICLYCWQFMVSSVDRNLLGYAS